MSPVECEPGVAETSGKLVELGKSDTETPCLGEQADIAFANSVFGQCWSLLKESDAMWRIYSPEKHGVKVKTTPRKLREALALRVEYPEVSAFIGRVRYESGSYLRDMVTDRVRMQNKIFDTSGKGHAETLLFKRDEFAHEEEVRLSTRETMSMPVKTFFRSRLIRIR